MVFDKTQDEMTDYDWRSIGVDPDMFEEATLPRKRLDIPLPYSSSGFYEIARRLHFLASEFEHLAKEPVKVADKLMMAMRRIEYTKAEFVDLRAAWADELKKSGVGESATKIKLITHSKVRMSDYM